jgi:transposase
MERNIIGDINIMNALGIKPNFSELSRKYGIDRHTIAKYYKEGKIPERKQTVKISCLDEYYEEIKEKMKLCATVQAAYMYFRNKYGEEEFKTYSTFAHYVKRKGIRHKRDQTVHVRYETECGEQLQVDWKEDIKIHFKNQEEYKFNLYVATLGFSRYHTYVLSNGRTTEDFLRCTIETLRILGGKPKHILTDNMSAVASITNGRKNKHEIIRQFEKDIEVPIKLCKTRTPETKGKVESSNRFVEWLHAYDYEIENEIELYDVIKRFNVDVNNQVNQTTQMAPSTLFKKEKEYLLPLPNKILLESYVQDIHTQEVPPTLLVRHKGKEYSVPPQFIHHRVKMREDNQKLYIYDSTELIAVHEIKNTPINYQESHYTEALRQRIKTKELDIEEISKRNLIAFEKGYK